MGRSATIPLQFGVVVLSTVIIAESEIPGPVGDVPRSPSTHSVTRLADGTLIDTIFVPPFPLSGCVKYSIFTLQFVFVGLLSVRNSLNPAPTRPSAKYQSLLTGPVAGVGSGVGLGDCDGDGVGIGADTEA